MSTQYDPELKNFADNPENYVLYVHRDKDGKESIKAAHKGIGTWIAAHTFSWLKPTVNNDYKLSTVLAVMEKLKRNQGSVPGIYNFKAFNKAVEKKVDRFTTENRANTKEVGEVRARWSDFVHANKLSLQASQIEVRETPSTPEGKATRLTEMIEDIRSKNLFEDDKKRFMEEFERLVTRDMVNLPLFAGNATIAHQVAKSLKMPSLVAGIIEHLRKQGGDEIFAQTDGIGRTPYDWAVSKQNQNKAVQTKLEQLDLNLSGIKGRPR